MHTICVKLHTCGQHGEAVTPCSLSETVPQHQKCVTMGVTVGTGKNGLSIAHIVGMIGFHGRHDWRFD